MAIQEMTDAAILRERAKELRSEAETSDTSDRHYKKPLGLGDEFRNLAARFDTMAERLEEGALAARRIEALSTMAEIHYRSVGGYQTVNEDCSAEWWESSDGEAYFFGDTLGELADEILQAEENAARVIEESVNPEPERPA